MAIAGGATTAYDVWIENGALECNRTTALSSICDDVDRALDRLRSGKDTLVRGSDMHRLRTAWLTGGQVAANGD